MTCAGFAGSADTSAAIILVPMTVFAITTVLALRYRAGLKRRGNELAPGWRRLADELGLDYERPAIAPGLISGVYRNRRLRVTVVRRGRGLQAKMLTRIECELPPPPATAEFQIERASWPRSGSRITTGNEAFDETFDLMGDNAKLLHAIFDEPLTNAILEVDSRSPIVAVGDQEIASEVRGFGVEADVIRKTVNDLVELSHSIERAVQRGGPEAVQGPFRS